MPDRIEIATTGRARCRACKRPIEKGLERFAEAAPNPVAEGETQHYYHLACAAERRPKAFSELLARPDTARPDLEPLARAAALALAHHRLERLGTLERAKSARASCRFCREAIGKDAWRVALQPIEEGRLAAWGFIHLDCVVSYAGIKPELARLLRYSELGSEETADVTQRLEALPESAPPAPEATVGNPEPAGEAPEDERAST